jgi:hypothetical protein
MARLLYALVASLPYSGAQTAFFSLDHPIRITSQLGGRVRKTPPLNPFFRRSAALRARVRPQ